MKGSPRRPRPLVISPKQRIILQTHDQHELELDLLRQSQNKDMIGALEDVLNLSPPRSYRHEILLLAVHSELNPHSGLNSCILSGPPVIQCSTCGTTPSIFDSIYWPRCDGTYQNALGHRLLDHKTNAPKLHCLLKMRLRDLIVCLHKYLGHGSSSDYFTFLERRLGCDIDTGQAYSEHSQMYNRLKDCFVHTIELW